MRIKEIWKSLTTFGNMYEVSNYGRVKSFYPRHKYPHLMKPCRHVGGYLKYLLTYNGKTYNKTAHALVCEVFIGKRPAGKEVCHLDGNPKNNFLGNLKYGTPKENSSHGELHGTRLWGEKTHCAKLNVKQVVKIRSLKGSKTSKEIAKLFGVSQSAVLNIWRKHTWVRLP